MSRLGIALFSVAAIGACDPATLKHTPDAAKQSDAAPDAPPPHGPVTVKVYDPSNAGTVAVGVPVVFIEANGTVVGRPLTDSNGVATSDVHANATATAVIAAATGSTTTLMTLEGVQPNDNIVLGPRASTASTTDGTFTVNFPSNSNANNYNIVGPCGSVNTGANTGSATSYVMTITTDCKQSAMDILVIANNSSYQPIAYLEKPNVPYTAGGSTYVNGSYLLPGTFNANFTNVDASLTNLYFYRQAPAGYAGANSGISGTPANGMVSLSVPAFNAQTSEVVSRFNKGSLQNVVYQNMPGNTLTYDMDVGGTLLPFVGPVTADFANNKVSAPVDTTGTTSDPADMFLMSFNYSRPNGSGGTLSFQWAVIGPQGGDFTIPALPPEVGDVLPKVDDSIGIYSFAALVESSSLTWDMARLAPFDYTPLLNAPAINDTTNRLRVSRFFPLR